MKKYFKFSYLLNQEKQISKITEKTFRKPLETIDYSTKLFMELLKFVLKIHDETKDKELKNYCQYFLTTGNAVIQMIRMGRESILKGHYGIVMILMRTIINYLNMSIYIHHHPEDAKLLLTERRESFKSDKKYKDKFHEFNLKKELQRLGYKQPKEFEDIAKSTHGSLWGAQVFGFKGLKTPEDTYELSYSPKFSIPQSTSYLSFLVSVPLDFSLYCLIHFKEKGVDVGNKMLNEFKKLDLEVRRVIFVLEQQYQFLKNTPDEIQDALINKLKSNKNKASSP